jgi:hypothetical protein
MGAVDRLAGLMAATTRLAASCGGTRNRSSAKIAELSNLLSDGLTSLLEIGQRMGHCGGFNPSVLYTQGVSV